MAVSGADALDVRIVPYQPQHAAAFDRLNRHWLDSFALMEAADQADLADPEDAFLAPGGAIFVAESGTTAIGVCGLRPCEPGTYEIAKLAVDPQAQRRGIGRRLVQCCIDLARQRQAERIVLVSNARLTSAIALYESLGFTHQPIPKTFTDTYETADVFMTLDISERAPAADAPA
jgi:ribosomal protein S18 acetylase RimI-like enzyme